MPKEMPAQESPAARCGQCTNVDTAAAIQQRNIGPHLPRINIKETLELLECPVCCHSMMSPIFQCREGHSVCKECAEKLKTCPLCRNPTDIRCRALDRLTESIGDVPCRYAALGCPEVIRYILKKEHEQYCMFQDFKCLHDDHGCTFEGSPSELVQHLVTTHGYEEIQSYLINFCCNKSTIRTSDISEDQCLWQRHIYNCYDKYFVLRVHRRTDIEPCLCILLAALHSKHHSSRYTLSTQGNHRKYTFEGPVWSVLKGIKEAERVKDCLILPENIALFLSGGKGSESDLSFINLVITGEIIP